MPVSYITLTVDVVGSRSYSDEVQEAMRELIFRASNRLSVAFAAFVEIPFVISWGDAGQGVFRNLSAAYLYFRLLSMYCRPVELRAGLGKGSLGVASAERASRVIRRNSKEPESSIVQEYGGAQTGETTLRARAAISYVHARRQEYRAALFSQDGKTPSPADWLTTVEMDHAFGIAEMRTDAQKELALLVEVLHPIVLDSSRDVSSLCDPNYVVGLIEAREHLLGLLDGYRTRGDTPTKKLIDAWDEGYRLEVRPVVARYGRTLADGGRTLPPGMSTELEALVDLRRQGIDRLVKAGRVEQERSAAIAFCLAHDSSA